MADGTPAAPPARRADAPAAVYSPREDTFLLVPFARVPAGSRLLEVGAGRGLAALAAARSGARVVATDLNPDALRELRARALAAKLEIATVRTDLAHGLGQFDRILANPPYLPTRPEERDPDRWHNLALDGGPDGTRVTARLLRELPLHLAPGGDAFVVVSSLQSAGALRSIRRAWARNGGGREVVAGRRLGGERLEVWRLWVEPASSGSSGGAPRAPGPTRGTGGRPRTPPARRTSSTRGSAPGRTPAPDGASGRRRSLRGS
jgi:release factor glutamine methyltransferase